MTGVNQASCSLEVNEVQGRFSLLFQKLMEDIPVPLLTPGGLASWRRLVCRLEIISFFLAKKAGFYKIGLCVSQLAKGTPRTGDFQKKSQKKINKKTFHLKTFFTGFLFMPTNIFFYQTSLFTIFFQLKKTLKKFHHQTFFTKNIYSQKLISPRNFFL